MEELSPFITIAEAAQFLRVSRDCIRNEIKLGRLAARKHGRSVLFTKEDLLQYSERQRVVAESHRPTLSRFEIARQRLSLAREG